MRLLPHMVFAGVFLIGVTFPTVVRSAIQVPINLQNNFFADPSVTFSNGGFTAMLAEDASLFVVLLSNDPALGDAVIIDPAAGALRVLFDCYGPNCDRILGRIVTVEI